MFCPWDKVIIKAIKSSLWSSETVLTEGKDLRDWEATAIEWFNGDEEVLDVVAEWLFLTPLGILRPEKIILIV